MPQQYRCLESTGDRDVKIVLEPIEPRLEFGEVFFEAVHEIALYSEMQ